MKYLNLYILEKLHLGKHNKILTTTQIFEEIKNIVRDILVKDFYFKPDEYNILGSKDGYMTSTSEEINEVVVYIKKYKDDSEKTEKLVDLVIPKIKDKLNFKVEKTYNKISGKAKIKIKL